MTATVTLPWPNKRLSANWVKSVHWAKRAEMTHKARIAAAWETKAQGVKRMKADSLNVTITLHPPDARNRDFPNWQYACKAMIDGIADAAGIDDGKWKITWVDGEIRRPHGAVVVELEEGVLHETNIHESR